jgi:hypothetical protein
VIVKIASLTSQLSSAQQKAKESSWNADIVAANMQRIRRLQSKPQTQ